MTKLSKLLLLLLFIVAALTSCPQNCLHCDQDEQQCIICNKGYRLDMKLNACAPQATHFSHQHQEQWGGACRGGNRQSPINIVIRNTNLCPKDKVMLNKISTAETTISPKGEDLKAEFEKFSNLIFYDSGIVREFESAQFHWHSPSQHTVNGKNYDLELHIVHTENGVAGQYSVIGLLFNINDDLRSDASDGFNFINGVQDGPFTFPWNIRNKMFYHYKGSLTTPPCAETVEWFVITEVYDISRANFQKIKAAINEGKSNSREVQPLNGRVPMMIGKFCNILRRISN